LVRTNPAYANQIQQALAASGSQNAITAFAGVTGNVLIGAAGGAGGGAGGGGGGGQTGQGGFAFGGTNQGNGQPFGGQNYPTSRSLLTGAGVGSTTANNATVRSVSPH